MKSSTITIVFSLILTGCATRNGFVALHDMPVESLTDTRDPLEMSHVASKFCNYTTTLQKQLAAFKLAQDAHLAAPENPQISLTLAECAYFASELTNEKDIKSQLIRKGMEAAWLAGADEKQPIAAYYYGVFWGQNIRKNGLTALGKLPELEEMFAIAVTHPETDHGGPLRALGMLYLKAPAWPRSLGDLDKALEYLEKSIRMFPRFPLNHFFYAQALVEDESVEEASRHLDLAQEMIQNGYFGPYAGRWIRDIETFRDQMKR